jgi:large subunit ribosomal protein L9
MKILLKKDVEKLGKIGEIKEVKPGYARNFLIPKGLAVVSTEGMEAKIAREQEEEEKIKQGEKKKFEDMAKKLEGSEIVIETKVGKGKKLFGGIIIKDKNSWRYHDGKNYCYKPKDFKDWKFLDLD